MTKSAPAKGEIVSTELTVPATAPTTALDRVLRNHFQTSWEKARRAIATGKVSVDGERVLEPTRPVGPGARVRVDAHARGVRAGEALSPAALVHVDPYVVVANKPAGISSVPFGEEPGTLLDLVRTALRQREHRPIPPLGIVHRLDKDTSGLIVFCRTLAAKRHLKQQFRFHRVHRRYWALANGQVRDTTIVSQLVEDRGDGLRGSIQNPSVGQRAVTHVRVLERFGAATLLECRLETGRTHQIRIHLAESGHPLVGERVYSRGYSGPLRSAPRLMLHARELGFVHPGSDQPVRFEAEPPDDMLALLSELRRQSGAASRRGPERGRSRR